MAASSHIKDPNREQRDFTSRVIALFMLALLAIFVLIARMIHLQVADYEKYRTRSDQNRIQVQPIGPPRGLIFDRNGVLLADNQPVFTLALIAERVTDLTALLAELHKLVEFDERDVEAFNKRFERRRRPFESVPLKVVLSEQEIAALAVNRFRLPGVVVEAQLVRHYPMGALMGHAIGSVRRVSEDDLKVLDPVSYSATQFIGKLGIERVYERSLHGEVGYQQVETDARPSYATLARDFDLPETQVTNFLALARRRFRQHVLDALSELTGSQEEYAEAVRELLGITPP